MKMRSSKKVFINVLLGWVFLASGVGLWAQDAAALKKYTARDFFKSDDMVWFGLDFSLAKMVGPFSEIGQTGIQSGATIKTKFFRAWNMLVLQEPRHFKLKQTFRKTNIYNDIRVVEKNNQKVDPDKLMTYNDQRLKTKDIENLVAKYGQGEKKEGLGLVFVVENFSKTSAEGTLYITVFDIASKKLLIAERMTAKPSGIGLRNYWAGSIKRILTQMERHSYATWKSNYSL